MSKLSNLALPAVVVVIAALAGFWYANRDTTPDNSSATSFVGEEAQEAGEPLPDFFIGDVDAPLTVIEYASLTCPHCANFHAEVYPQIKANYIDTGKVKFVMREVYFDKYGLWAGLLARCGGEDRYFLMVDMLFKNQSDWLRGDNEQEIVGNLLRVGRQTGLSDEQMNACVQDQDLAKALVADYQLKAGQDEVRSTPSFVVDGELLGNMSYEDFEKLIEGKLN